MFKSHKKKIFYYLKIIVAIMRGIFSKKRKILKLYIDAIHAAQMNEKGVNSKYQPGTKVV